jgi:uncharacterized RDD family membrane protein YckC
MPDQKGPYKQPWEVPNENPNPPVPETSKEIFNQTNQSESIPTWKLPTKASETNQNTLKQSTSEQLTSADYVKRILAGAIDLVIITSIAQILVLFLNPISSKSDFFITIYRYLWPSIFFLYFLSLTVLTNSTVGKRIFGLKVNSTAGDKVSWLHIIIRETIGKYISFAIFNLGFIWIFIDGKGRGWHDKIAHTQVIDTKGVSSQNVTTTGLVISIGIGFVWLLFVPNQLYSLFPFLLYVQLIVLNIFPRLPLFFQLTETTLTGFILVPPNLVKSAIGLIPYESFSVVNVDVINNIRKITTIIPYIGALYPLALYLSRVNRSFIVFLLLIHMVLASILGVTDVFREVHRKQAEENKAAIGSTSEKKESLEKLCFKVYVPTYTNPSLRDTQVRGYDRLKPCESQYVYIRYERTSDKSQEVTIKENKNTHPSLVAIDEKAQTKTISGHEVKIIERKSSYSTTPEIIYRLIIDDTRIELTWKKSSKSVLSESDIEEIITSL